MVTHYSFLYNLYLARVGFGRPFPDFLVLAQAAWGGIRTWPDIFILSGQDLFASGTDSGFYLRVSPDVFSHLPLRWSGSGLSGIAGFGLSSTPPSLNQFTGASWFGLSSSNARDDSRFPASSTSLLGGCLLLVCLSGGNQSVDLNRSLSSEGASRNPRNRPVFVPSSTGSRAPEPNVTVNVGNSVSPSSVLGKSDCVTVGVLPVPEHNRVFHTGEISNTDYRPFGLTGLRSLACSVLPISSVVMVRFWAPLVRLFFGSVDVSVDTDTVSIIQLFSRLFPV